MLEATRTKTGAGTTPLGLGAAGMAAIGWGFAGIFATLASPSGIVLTFYRMWIGAGLLSVILIVSGRRISWLLLRRSLFGGLLLAGDMALFFSSIKLTSVAVATVISALQPALMMIAARPLTGEHVDRWDASWAGVAIAGVAAVALGAGVPGSHELLGDMLAIGSLLSWSGYFLVAKRARRRVDALDYTAGVMITGAIPISIVALLSGASLAGVRAGDWLWIALLAVVPGSAHLLMNWAHRYVDVSVSSLIGSANPVVAATAGFVILGQALSPVQVAGGLLGVAAIAIVASRHRHQPEPPVP
ncbi:MAG: DMT family transporter [Acidimicrobiales bacterium]